MASPWSIQRLALYRSGRAEAVYSDGSAAILHPSRDSTGSSSVTSISYFAANGARQRLLCSCLPRHLCGKIVAAATLRDRFHPTPSLLSSPAKRRSRWLRPSTHVAWPSCGYAAEVLQHEDGGIAIESLDQKAKLLLAPHARSYVVEWWQPSVQSGELDLIKVVDDLEALEPQIHPSSGWEYLQQVQCFSVAEHVQLSWLYPLFLALMFHREQSPEPEAVPVSRLSSLKAQLEHSLATGQLVDSGMGVTGPYPQGESDVANTLGEACDHVSPAVSMGEPSEGCVRVLWTPGATLWLPADSGEATIDVSMDAIPCDGIAPVQWLLLESSLQGRFWKPHAAGALEVPSVIHSDFSSSVSMRMSKLRPLIDEAAQWLRHNAAAATPLSVAAATDVAPGSGWVPEVEISEGKTHLAIFTSSGGSASRLLRLLFPDGARLSFTFTSSAESALVAAQAAMGSLQQFKLITSGGEVFRRSFGTGTDFHVATLQAMLRRAMPCGESHADALAQGALRRSRLALERLPVTTCHEI